MTQNCRTCEHDQAGKKCGHPNRRGGIGFLGPDLLRKDNPEGICRGWRGMDEFWETGLILRVISGSHAYGTATADSDWDYRGVCIPPEKYLLGLDRFDQKEFRYPRDEVIYSLEKFVSLALANNPNILEILFAENDAVSFVNDIGQDLLALRYDFLSKRVFKTFGGYARSQLLKIQRSNKWDTKNALHLIRLLETGVEILQTNHLQVKRPNADYLLNIRRGEVSLDEVLARSEGLEVELRMAYEESTLPEHPNYNRINEWLIHTHWRSMIKRGY